MAFSKEVQIAALVACGRYCCICHKFCGAKIELHHIIQKADGGEDSLENCIPLCFECHADMGKRDAHHPKGKGYFPEELRKHRDNWYQKKQTTYTTQVSESDKKLFNDICNVFQPLKYTLVEVDLSWGTEKETFDLLKELVYDEGNPFMEFIDADFESARVRLISAAEQFLNYYKLNTFSCGDRWVPHIYLMEIGEIDYDKKMQERFEEEARKLNELATKLWTEYQEFVRTCRHQMN